MNLGYRLSSAEIETSLGPDRDATLALLKRVARGEVTEFVASDRSRTYLIPAEARMVLLRLPDAEVLDTIGNQLGDFQPLSPYAPLRSNLFHEAVRAKQPRLLPYLARGMFRDGDAELTDFRMANAGNINRSGYSTWMTMKLVEAADEFAPDVKAWARAMQSAHHLSENEKRDIGRAWWKDNESAILAGNYAAVRPGISSAAGMPRTRPNVPPNPDDAKRIGPTQQPGTQASEPNVAPKLGTADVAASPASRSSGWVPWAGVAIILGTVAGWLLLRLKGRQG